MGESKISDLTAISDAAADLPDPVQKGLVRAISNLLGGLTSIPAALLRRPAQAIEDITAARSATSEAIALAVAKQAVSDPVLMQAAAEIYLPSTLRKVRNRVQVAERAIEHARESGSDSVEAGPPDDDWLNTFTRFAEDASSEKLQDLFSRILAGQVLQPGSYSLATLRTVAELDQSIAQDFSLVWAKSVGNAVDYTAEFNRGEWFSRWQRLVEAGLMAPSQSARFLPPFSPVINKKFSLWSPVSTAGNSLVIQYSKDCNVSWKIIGLTRIGQQLGSILAKPDYAENIREVGRKLIGPGIVRVELWRADNSKDLVYSAPPN